MHTCRTCGDEKPKTDFYVNQKCGTLSLDCKPCYRTKVRRNRAENIEYYKDYDRRRSKLQHRINSREEYAKTEAGRRNLNAGKRAYICRNPLKRAAHTATKNAIRSGKLIPQPCEKCNEQKAEAHHDDYSKPLDVRWLCKRHHDEHHKQQRRQSRSLTGEKNETPKH